MASTSSRRKPRQRRPPANTDITNLSSQCLTTTTVSEKPCLGDFSKIFSLLNHHHNPASPTDNDNSCAQQPAPSQSISPSSRLLYIPDSIVRDIMGGKVPKLKSKAGGQNATIATSPLLSPPISATSSDSDSISSRGDFDPVDMELDLNGGAGLSDVTTPPATPPPKATSVSAGDLLFERHTAHRLPVSFEESFSNRLAHQFVAHDQQFKQMCAKLDGKVSHDRVYIFVDGSNISTSFYQDLKKKFGMRHNEPLPGCLDIVKLHEILQRDRHVMASHIVGSKAPGKTEAQYFFDAEEIGYQKTILPRIPKDGKKPFSNTSDSDDIYSRRREPMQEHQVDENLQHLMINCAVDNINNKGVIILVTGDGNSNESGTSDGFPAHVVRCLSLGWAVEVYSFESACSEVWTQPELLNNKEWAGRVSVHYLDSYLHDLCKPSFEKQLSEVAAKHATRASCRPTPMTLKRMTPIAEDKVASPHSHAAHLDNDWRTPSPKKAKFTAPVMSECQSVTATKSHTTSDYQTLLQNASTFGAIKTTCASTNGFVAVASARSNSTQPSLVPRCNQATTHGNRVLAERCTGIALF